MPSKVIRSFAYDAPTQQLTIWFQSGRCYRYLNVPERTYLSMRSAFSKGVFFNRHIRDRYQCVDVSIGAEEPPPYR